MFKEVGVPGIVFNIDSVLTSKNQPLSLFTNAIQILKKPLKDLDPNLPECNQNLPSTYISNEGGVLESEKAEQLNIILNLKSESSGITADEVVLNYTPLRPIMQEHKDQLVVLTTTKNTHSMACEFGLKKYITIEDYATLYSAQAPKTRRPREGPIVDEMRKKIADRLGISDHKVFDESLVVSAVFILDLPSSWYEHIQILSDLFTTSDGKVADQIPLTGLKTHIPIYCTSNETLYYTDYKLPRVGFGMFNEALKDVYKQLYNRDLNIQCFGSLSNATYRYIEEQMRKRSSQHISKIYMIGCDSDANVECVKSLGWKPILIRSDTIEKINQLNSNEEFPSEYIVDNIYEGVKLILKLERINLDLV